MKRDMISQVNVQSGDLKINISGRTDEGFGSQDLQLRAILALLNFDFKLLQEDDPTISDKYFMVLLNRLGEVIKVESGVDFKLDNLVFLKNYLDWLTDVNVRNDPELIKFIGQYQEIEDEAVSLIDGAYYIDEDKLGLSLEAQRALNNAEDKTKFIYDALNAYSEEASKIKE